MVCSSTSETIQIEGLECCIHSWNNNNNKEEHSPPPRPRGLVIFYHGFLAHGRYPTVRYAAEWLATNQYIVVAADMPGHGQSAGLRGYLPSAGAVIQHGVTIAQHVIKTYNNDNKTKLPLFLIGSSMGGTIALSVAKQWNETNTTGSTIVAGVVLLAPMLALKVGAPARTLLWTLSYILPTLSIIPSSSSSTSADQQYRDPIKKQECQDDELSIPGSTIRIGSAWTCIELATTIQSEFTHVTIPFLCMVALDDVVVDNAASYQLVTESPSVDKTLKEYHALHGLLCEPSPLVDEIQNDMLSWLNERSSSSSS